MADEQQSRHDAEKREDWSPELVRFHLITFLSCRPYGPRRMRADVIRPADGNTPENRDPGERETGKSGHRLFVVMAK
ncbi:hypothetical protein GCM10027161_22170 [Microbispora hainanensis]